MHHCLKTFIFILAGVLLAVLPGEVSAQNMEKTEKQPQAVSAFPVGEENTAYARYFTGRSYLAPLTGDSELGVPISNVTFEPSCRNHWHSHTGGQILIAVGGVGYYQEKDRPARKLTPGDVVEIAPGVIHWHGAAPDSWFSHLAIECHPQTNRNTWLDPVSDREYALATADTSQALSAGKGELLSKAGRTEGNDTSASEKKDLVVYFSCTGTTQAAAERLAALLGADLYRIRPAEEYSAADLNWRDAQSRSSVEMRDPASRPTIAGRMPDVEGYRRIFIGYPIWWDLAPRIIETFLEHSDLSGRPVIPFATSGGSGIEASERSLRAAYPQIDWKKGRLLNSFPDKARIEQWLSGTQE